jgi:hypothetical protein
MKTLENTALPRREGRQPGPPDAELPQQVADLNLRGIEVLRQVLLASGAASAAAVTGGDDLALRPAGRRRGGPRRRPDLASDEGGARGVGGAARSAGPYGARLALARAGRAMPVMLPASGGASLPAALRRLAPDWLALEPAALQRVAACPYLLFELDFAGLLGAIVAPPRVVQEEHGVPGSPAREAAPFTGAEGRSFARKLFLYAWHLVRSAPSGAAFALGAPPAALEPLHALGLARIEELGALAGGWVRLRWEDEPLVWADWLAAARSGNPAALWASQLRGLQRIAGACREFPASC